MAATENLPNVAGFRLCDFDVACGARGTCPAQEKLVAQYVGGVTEEGIETGVAFTDRALLLVALRGYKATIRRVGCEGEDGGRCPALVEMNGSRIKRTVIQGLKKRFLREVIDGRQEISNWQD